MEPLDIDAGRAARAELRNGETKAIKFGGELFELPAEWPYDAALAAAVGDMKMALQETFAPGDFERFWDHGPTVQDLRAIAEYLEKVYAASEGEPSASATS